MAYGGAWKQMVTQGGQTNLALREKGNMGDKLRTALAGVTKAKLGLAKEGRGQEMKLDQVGATAIASQYPKQYAESRGIDTSQFEGDPLSLRKTELSQKPTLMDIYKAATKSADAKFGGGFYGVTESTRPKYTKELNKVMRDMAKAYGYDEQSVNQMLGAIKESNPEIDTESENFKFTMKKHGLTKEALLAKLSNI